MYPELSRAAGEGDLGYRVRALVRIGEHPAVVPAPE
jgi:hypothetical protein